MQALVFSVTARTIRLRLDDGKFRLFDSHGRSQEEANAFLAALETRGLSIHTVRAYGFDLVALLRWLALDHRGLTELKTSLTQ